MGVINTSQSFANGDSVTSTKLNNITSGSTFDSSAVSGTGLTVTGGGLLSLGTVASSNMGTNSVLTGSIADLNVTTAKLADTAVTTAKITDLNITTGKIADLSVTFGKMATAAIGTKAELEASTASKLVAADLIKHSPPVAKAYGSFTVASSARTLTGSINVSVTRINSNSSQVTFTSALAVSEYTVVAQVSDSASSSPGTIDGNPIVYNKTTTGFKILHSPEATNRAIDFVVFGSTLA